MRHGDGAHLRFPVRRNHVDVGSSLALLHGRRCDGQPVLSRVDEQSGIDQLARPQAVRRIGKSRLELNGARRLGNLVVDQQELALIQLDLVVLAVGNHGQRPFGHLFLDPRQLRLRQGEDQRDRLDLRHHHEAVGIGRMDDVADIDLSHAGDSRNRRRQPGIAQLDFGLLDQRLIGFDRTLQLGDLRLLRVGQLWRCIALVLQLRVAAQVGDCIGELRLIPIAIGDHLVELRLVGPWIDLGEQIAGLDGLPFGEGDLGELTLDLAPHNVGIVADHRADAAQIERHLVTAHDAGDNGHRGRCDGRYNRLFKGRSEREVQGARDRQHGRRQGRKDNGFPVHLPPCSCRRMGQHPGAPIVPAEDLVCLVVEPSGNVPVIGHGDAAAVPGAASIVARGAVTDGTTGDTNIVETGGAGLSPASPNSVEPSGMPARPALNVGRAGIDEPPAPVPAQPLDAAPAMPPPSNSGAAAWDVGPPGLEQPMAPIVEDGAGLVPGVVISVAPNGMPVGATGTPEPTVRGDAAPSGDVPTPPTCAEAELPPRRETAKAAITRCIFMGVNLLEHLNSRRCRQPRDSARLCDGQPIRRRRDARRLVERCGERARFAVADGHSDIRHRRRGLRQQKLGAFDATAVVISMRRHAERLLEGPAEIIRLKPTSRARARAISPRRDAPRCRQ